MNPRCAMGCDLVALSDVAESVCAFGDRYLRRVFTDQEVRASGGGTRVERLAARFAAKEAVVKALRLTDEATSPHEVEVLGSGGPPCVVLHGEMARHARERGWVHIHLSLSHTDTHAMAVVVAELDQVAS